MRDEGPGNLAPTVHGETPEVVAFHLMIAVALSEGKTTSARTVTGADTRWILSTYARCLAVAKREYTAEGAISAYPYEG